MSFLLHSLYSPLAWFFFGTLAAWCVLVVRFWRIVGRCERWLLGLFGAGLALMGAFSSPLGSLLLHNSLLVPHPSIGLQEAVEPAPDFILVAASGYLIMGDPREDVLRDGTASRVARAAALHKLYPDAVLIMQGTGFLAGPNGSVLRPAPHQGELMARLAVSMGVPRDKIRLEGQSRNSREHVLELLSFPGVTRDARLVVVSSDWHIRRLQMVFRPVFPHTRYLGSDSERGLAGSERGLSALSLRAVWPDEAALQASRTYLREWAAIIFYALGGRL